MLTKGRPIRGGLFANPPALDTTAQLKHPCSMHRLIFPLALAVLTACNSASTPQPENLCETKSGCVSAPARDVLAVDGDTFELRRLTLDGEQRIRLRLIGWDSPETGDSAACPAENTLGEQVEAHAKALFEAGDTITFLPEGTDRYGRTRAHVYLDGVHIGWTLAQAGLSEEWAPHGVKPDWCN